MNVPGGGTPLAGVRVLVANHYQPLRWLLAHLLRRSGAEVQEVSTGLDALAVLEKGNIDVALLDSGLPDIPMAEVRNKMRTMPAAEKIPVVYTTSSEAEPPPHAGEASVGDPLNVKEVVRTILLLLGRATLSVGF